MTNETRDGKNRVVTVRLPGTDADDCLHCMFGNYYDALSFAADCAERIDKSVWNDCVCDSDGRVIDALSKFNDRDVFAGPDAELGRASITISAVFATCKVRAYCAGDNDWYKK